MQRMSVLVGNISSLSMKLKELDMDEAERKGYESQLQTARSEHASTLKRAQQEAPDFAPTNVPAPRTTLRAGRRRKATATAAGTPKPPAGRPPTPPMRSLHAQPAAASRSSPELSARRLPARTAARTRTPPC